MGWAPPKERSTLLDDIPQSSNFAKDALMLDYQDGLAYDESFVVRVVTLDPADTCKVPCRKCAKTYVKKDGSSNTYTGVCIPDPGHPHNAKIIDDAGKPMSDGDVAYTWLVPVLYMYKCDAQSNIVEEGNELRYIKYTAMIANGIKDLQDNVDDGYGFETIPDYDVRIKKFKGKNGKAAYEVLPVRKLKDPETGRLTNCPRFESTLEEAIGEEGMTYLAESMEDMIAHIRSVEEKMCSVESVKDEFQRYRTAEGGQAAPAAEPAKAKSGMASRPTRAAAAPAAEEEVTPEDETEVEAPPAERPKLGAGRFPKLGAKK